MAYHRLKVLEAFDQRISDALTDLNGSKNDAELLSELCVKSAAVFNSTHALLARVDGGFWSAWGGYRTEARPRTLRWDEAREIPIEMLPSESATIEEGPKLVPATRARKRLELPELFQRITEGSHVIAPIFVRSDAVGILYLAESTSPFVSQAEFVDRVQKFVSRAGYLLEKELLYERFRTQREIVKSALLDIEQSMNSIDTGVHLVRLVRRADRGTVSTADMPLETRSSSWDEVLTLRERDVIGLVAHGYNNEEIAAELAITSNTVKTHLRNMMQKMGAVTRTELIARYHEVAP